MVVPTHKDEAEKSYEAGRGGCGRRTPMKAKDDEEKQDRS